MKLTIFAATGGIGRQILEQALDAGHDVTAVVRNPQKLPGELPGQVRVVIADLADPDPATLKLAVEGADAVLSGLGAAIELGGWNRYSGHAGHRRGDEGNRHAAHRRRQRRTHRDRALIRQAEPT